MNTITTYIMSNLKHILIASSISFILGIYSFVNLFLHLKRLEDSNIDQKIELNDKIKNVINKTKENYDRLNMEYTLLKEEIINLKKIITSLEKKNFKNIESPFSTDSLKLSSDGDNDVSCDELCNINNNIPHSTMNILKDSSYMKEKESRLLQEVPLFNEKEDNINEIKDIIDYNYITTELNIQEIVPSKKSSKSRGNSFSEKDTKVRSRSASGADIDWIRMTKFFLFG